MDDDSKILPIVVIGGIGAYLWYKWQQQQQQAAAPVAPVTTSSSTTAPPPVTHINTGSGSLVIPPAALTPATPSAPVAIQPSASAQAAAQTANNAGQSVTPVPIVLLPSGQTIVETVNSGPVNQSLSSPVTFQPGTSAPVTATPLPVSNMLNKVIPIQKVSLIPTE